MLSCPHAQDQDSRLPRPHPNALVSPPRFPDTRLPASSPQPTARRPIPRPRWILPVIRPPWHSKRSRGTVRSRSHNELEGFPVSPRLRPCRTSPSPVIPASASPIPPLSGTLPCKPPEHPSSISHAPSMLDKQHVETPSCSPRTLLGRPLHSEHECSRNAPFRQDPSSFFVQGPETVASVPYN